jgi:hypothetical protein
MKNIFFFSKLIIAFRVSLSLSSIHKIHAFSDVLKGLGITHNYLYNLRFEFSFQTNVRIQNLVHHYKHDGIFIF